jgi:uncharacterized membrane protein
MNSKSLNLRLVGFLALILSYSLLAHYTLQSKTHATIGVMVALAPIVLTCFVLAYKAKHRILMLTLLLLASPLFWLIWSHFKQHYDWIYWLVHESLQFVLFIMFARTLMPDKQPLCSQFAQMVHGSLSPELVDYTRNVTIAWSLFFIIVMIISSWLFFFHPIKVWSIFSNFVYLPLVAMMFIIEYIVRFWVLPKKDRANIMHAVHAFMNKAKH